MSGLRIKCLLIPTTEPGPRDDCPDSVHDWPLPDDYLSAGEEATWRLAHKWSQGRACARCGKFGWRVVGELREGQARTSPVHGKDQT